MASVRDLKIRELKQLAKERGLKGYSKKIKLNWFKCYKPLIQIKMYPVVNMKRKKTL